MKFLNSLLIVIFIITLSCSRQEANFEETLNHENKKIWTGVYSFSYCYSLDSSTGTSECYDFNLIVKDSIILEANGNHMHYKILCNYRDANDTLLLSINKILDGHFPNIDQQNFLKLIKKQEDYYFLSDRRIITKGKLVKASKKTL